MPFETFYRPAPLSGVVAVFAATVLIPALRCAAAPPDMHHVDVAAAPDANSAPPARRVISVDLPKIPPAEPKLIARLGPGPARENSGIVKSRNYPDLFWMHYDSGDEPRIYPIHRDGVNYANERYPNEHSVLVGGAINVDWEDITCDADGTLIIADVGNNGNDRRDLTLYYVDEPTPAAGRTTFRKKVFIRFPDQREFPASRGEFNFDCEAVFTVGDTVYFLTKNRSNAHTSLYALVDSQAEVVNPLTYLGTFDVEGQAVAADCSADGKRLAVLTYTGVWLFERESLDQNFFQQSIRWAPLRKHDAEAICFADERVLLLADESSAELFELAIDALTSVRP